METVSYEIYSEKELPNINAKENELALNVITKKIYKHIDKKWEEPTKDTKVIQEGVNVCE